MHKGGGANVTPFKLPRPLFIATPTRVLAGFFWIFYIDRSRIGLLGSKRVEAFVGVALALWA